MSTIDLMRQDRSALEAEIREAGSPIRGTSCHCPHPEHDDRNPSAAIYADDAGVWRAKCHSCGWCGDLFDLRAVLRGQPVDELLRELRAAEQPAKANQPTMRQIARRYFEAISDEQRNALADRLGLSCDALRRLRVGWCSRDQAYSFPMRDAGGEVCGLRLRRDDGKFAERGSRDGLFIPADLSGDGPLVIAEGPTDCAALIDMGVDAIGRANNSARNADELIAEYLRRHPRDEIYIIHDRDAEGSKAATATTTAAERLAGRLVPLVSRVRVFTPPEPHNDARAWRNAGAIVDDLDAAADQATPHGPAGELAEFFQSTIDGRRYAIDWPHRLVTAGTEALLPGTVTLICGDPGAGKSLWLLECFAHWHDAGERVAVMMLEDERAYHLSRLLAQRSGAAWLTDSKSVRDRGDEALAHHREHDAWTDSIGRQLWCEPESIKLMKLVEWVQARAAEGNRIIVIDPVSLAETSDRPWDDARNFLQAVKPLLAEHGASLVLVTHPKMNKHKGAMRTLDDLAGGLAWTRFSHCVLWLERHDEQKQVTVRGFGHPLPSQDEVNRTLRVMKARSGKGAGWQLAFDFDPQTLRFHERGAIVKGYQQAEAKT